MKAAMITLPVLNGKAIIKRETEKAILIEVNDNQSEWFPKSQLQGILSTDNGVYLVTTYFMMKEKGLSYRGKMVDQNDIHTAINNHSAVWC